MHTENKLYLKVPKNLKTSVHVQRSYSNYLWFKSMNRFGIIEKSKVKFHKNRVGYWSKKLISNGWMEDCGDHFRLKSYQTVWKLIGVDRVNKRKGLKGYAYIKLINLPTSKEIFEAIREFIVRRVKQQIVFRLSTARGKSPKSIKKTVKPKYSCKAMAKALGYKAAISGCKYRKKYMKVIKPEDSRVEIYLDLNGVRAFRNPCYFISLD